MKSFNQGIILLFCSSFICSVASADSIEEMVSLMSQKLGDFKTLNESVVRGGLRVRLCQYCHGKDGNSTRAGVPNLAEQNPIYLLTQFEYFRTDKRKNKVMNELAKSLTKDERVNVALYYASQKVAFNPQLKNVNSSSYKSGAGIYKNICANCHGAKGYGEQNLPRLAGQQSEFINKTLKAYKEQKKIRPDSPMNAISAALSEEDIASVATFVSFMQ